MTNQPLRVLQIEDNESDAGLMARALEKHGFAVKTKRVQTAEEMQNALSAESWDVIIADCSLPQFSAEAALKVLQERGQDVPFIVVSGVVGEETAVALMKQGAHDFVVKGNLSRLPHAVARELSEAKVRQERAQAEAAARAGEIRYRRLFDEATEGIALADAQTGILLNCNQAFLRLTGYNKSEIIGQHQSVLHPSNGSQPGLTTTFVQHLGEMRDQVLETHLVTKAGQVKEVEIKAHLLNFGGTRVLQGFFRDMTEERRGQREREITLTLLRLLNDQNHTHELVQSLTKFLQRWIGCEAVGVRLQEGGDFPYFETRGFSAEFVQAEKFLCSRSTRCSSADQASCEGQWECLCGQVLAGQLDRSRSFVTARGSFWVNHLNAWVRQAAQVGLPLTFRGRCFREGYESLCLIPLSHAGRTLGLLQLNDRSPGRFSTEQIQFLEGVADQISIALAQRQAQAALRQSEEQYRLLFNSANDVIVMFPIDSAGQPGLLAEVNDVACERLGYTREEMHGFSVLDLRDPETVDKSTEVFRRLLDEGPQVYETAHITKDDERIPVEVSSRVIQHEGKLSVLSIARDIRERKRLQSQLLQAQKMEAVGQLAGGVAHDFNNILAAVLMQLGLLQNDSSLSQQIRDSIAELEEGTMRAVKLTRQLLVFSRRQMTDAKPLDLHELVKGMVKMLRRLIPENVEIVIESPAEPVWVNADPGMIEQVVMNLCINSRDAMPKGGHLRLGCDLVQLDERGAQRNPQAKTGRFARLTVKDDGCGMDSATLERIFEPFFTTKAPGHGTGLGLATVYGIVKQHEGWVEVESAAGQGSSFHAFLPAMHKPASVEASPDGRAELPRGNETILVVEDEVSVRRLTALSLRTLGYAVLEASTSMEALEVWKKDSQCIQLLLTDIIMPGQMSGLELAEKLLAQKPALRVICSTGYRRESTPATSFPSPNITFLPKPYRFDKLAVLVRRWLDQESAS